MRSAFAPNFEASAWAELVVLGVDDGAFWSQMQAKVSLFDDIANGVIKSVVFGVAVTWIAVFEGYDAERTAELFCDIVNRFKPVFDTQRG